MYKVSLHALACFINKDTHSNGHSQKDIKNYGTLPISGGLSKISYYGFGCSHDELVVKGQWVSR